MEHILTSAEVRDQIERYLAGSLGREALAAWAFKQFADAEEELLLYEPNDEDLIAEVLDDLMWGDEAPFALDPAMAHALVERLK